MKKLLMVLSATSIMALAACGEVEETTVKPEPKQEQQVKKPKKEEKPVEKVSKTTSKDEQEVLIELREVLSGTEVSFNKKTKIYKVELTSEKMVYELAAMELGNASKDSWYNLVESTKGTSEFITEQLGDGYSITLTNPGNSEKIILWIMDGIVLYDIFPKN